MFVVNCDVYVSSPFFVFFNINNMKQLSIQLRTFHIFIFNLLFQLKCLYMYGSIYVCEQRNITIIKSFNVWEKKKYIYNLCISVCILDSNRANASQLAHIFIWKRYKHFVHTHTFFIAPLIQRWFSLLLFPLGCFCYLICFLLHFSFCFLAHTDRCQYTWYSFFLSSYFSLSFSFRPIKTINRYGAGLPDNILLSVPCSFFFSFFLFQFILFGFAFILANFSFDFMIYKLKFSFIW